MILTIDLVFIVDCFCDERLLSLIALNVRWPDRLQNWPLLLAFLAICYHTISVPLPVPRNSFYQLCLLVHFGRHIAPGSVLCAVGENEKPKGGSKNRYMRIENSLTTFWKGGFFNALYGQPIASTTKPMPHSHDLNHSYVIFALVLSFLVLPYL